MKKFVNRSKNKSGSKSSEMCPKKSIAEFQKLSSNTSGSTETNSKTKSTIKAGETHHLLPSKITLSSKLRRSLRRQKLRMSSSVLRSISRD